MTTDVVLTVDAELFIHTPAYRRASGTIEDEMTGIAGIRFLLDLFDRYDVRSTFFVVSEIAESHPELVERIAAEGHEIASHTHTHRLLSDLDTDEYQAELTRSKAILEDVTGGCVSGFRAPAFDRPEGFFDAIDEAGYEYDSSIVPARSIPGWYGGEYAMETPASVSAIDDQFPAELVELPVSVMPWLRLPISAAWIRLLGRTYFSTGIRWLHRRDSVPVLYVHPWEFVELPVVDGVPKRVYWRTGEWFRRTMESLVEKEYEFGTVASFAEFAGEVQR